MGTGLVDGLKKGLATLAVLGLAGPAFADGMDKKSLKDAPAEEAKSDLSLTANAAVTSDYIFRGFSQSKERPALQAGVDLTYKWFYAGAWGSTIDFGRDGPFDVAHTEIDFYAGIKPVLGKVTFDLGVIYYTYPRARDGVPFSNRELNYVEAKLGASAEVWKDGTLGATVYYSPNYTNDTGDVWTVEGTFAQVLPKMRDITPTLSGTLGYQMGDDIRYLALVGNGSDDYLYWNLGVNLGFGDRFSLDFRYWDTDIKTNNAAAGFTDGFCDARLFGCDPRFVATAKVTY